MQAKWQGKVIAESDRSVDVHGYRYFPRDAVRMELLRAAPKTRSDRACPHGVQFYDVTVGGARHERVAWSYEAPTSDAVKRVARRFGFWRDVQVS